MRGDRRIECLRINGCLEPGADMKTLIVYFSKFGNTRRVAEAIAETLKQAGEARVVSIDQLAASNFEGVDLVVMGSPTHAFSVPQTVRSSLAALPPGILTGKSVAAFDTTVRLWPLRLFRASSKTLRLLRRLGGQPIARPQTFFVQTHSTQKTGEIDLLLEGQMDRAKDWADQILRQLRS
jgi:flavodoxin